MTNSQKSFGFLIILISLVINPVFGQVLSSKNSQYTHADSLRGSLRAERAYDVLKYHLQVKVVPEEKYISGFNTISFKTEQELPVMQIDLFENMKVDSIIHHDRSLEYKRKFNAVFVSFEEPLKT